jgi:hypothetical protein
MLFFTALACAVMAIIYVLSRPAQAVDEAPRFLAGLGTAVGVAVVLAAYPLWWQFAGPQHTHGPLYWAGNWFNDLAGLPGYPRNGISGWISAGSYYNNAVDETNGFLGLPVLVLALVTAVTLWHVLAVRIAAVITVLFLTLSLGDPIHIKGEETIPGPWRLLKELPLFDSVIVSRWGLVATPAAAVLIACAGDRLVATLRLAGSRDAVGPAARREAARRRVIVWGVLAAVLLPVAPMPIKAVEPMRVPSFFTSGTWRAFVDGGTIVPVPPGTASEPTLRWILATDLQVRFTDGYFYGPSSADDATMRYGPIDRPTRHLLQHVSDTGEVPAITEELRAIALTDLRFWEADVLVYEPHNTNVAAVRQLLDGLLGRHGVWVAEVWVWDVRDLV